MEFRVLGPLRVVDGDRLLPIPSTGKRATVLAALLVHRNRVVPARRLIAWLWGDEPPEGAAAALQAHVVRLRAALGQSDAGQQPLLTRGQGYELRVDAEALDAARFEDMVVSARGLLGPEPASAASTLREALALWRGHALTGFEEEPFARAESVRLEELRLAAAEGLMEAELALGGHAAITGQLQSLVAEHPTRERLTAQLMRALYRTGRQAEALQAYQRLRERLVEELGIDPSPELRQLERAVLRQELEAPPGPDVRPPAVVGKDAFGDRPQADVAPSPRNEQRSSMADVASGTVRGRSAGTATVLFTDLVGSTELLSRIGEEAFDHLRRSHFTQLRGAIQRAGGEVVKTMGDGLLVVFTSAVDAVGCAVSMQQTVDRQARKGAPLSMRVGLAIGDVSFEEGDVFGVPAVEAARLVAAARGGQILATALVRAVAGGRANARFAEMGCLELKGLPEPVATCEVTWEPLPASSVPLPALLSRQGRIFVGRDREMEQLEGHWREAVGGEPGAVLVAGEPGVGKTRLVAELAARVNPEGAIVLGGRCDEDLGVPYQPFVEALRHLADHSTSEDLGHHLGRYGGELTRLVPELTERLPSLPAPLRSDPETERYRLFDAVAAWLAATSADESVLLVLDDLQWAAKPTLLLLRHVLRSSESMRLLVLATYRDTEIGRTHPLSELLADLRRSDSVTRISLSGLDRPAVAAFLEEAAGHDFGAEKAVLADAIHQETEGNAFLVREVVRHLIETGSFRQQGDLWTTVLPVEKLGIPEGVRDVLGRRLSRLSAMANQVLAVAAVVGQEFELAVVERAANLQEDALLAALDEALTSRLVAEVAGPAPRYRFAHALVRDTLYDELSAARRVSLHGRVAEAIETCHAGGLDDHLPALAHHWAKASAPAAETARAVDYAVLAGNRALAQLAHDEAVLYYRQALDLLDAASVPPDDRRRMDVLIALGDAQRRAGEPAFRGTLLDVARLAHECGNDDALIRAALATNRGVWSAVWTVDRERVAVLEAALVAARPADSAARARLLADLGAELAFSGQRSRRLALTGEAIRIARDLGDPVTLAHCLIARCAATFVDPDSLADSLGTTAELVETADRLRDPFIRAWGQYHRHAATFQAGLRDEADEALDAFECAASEAGQPLLRSASTLIRAGQSIAAASLPEAEEIGRKVRDDIIFFSEPDAPSIFGTLRYVIRYEQGRLDELIPRLEVTARTTDRAAAWALLALAYCELERGDQARRVWARFATTVGDTSIGPVGGMVMAPAAEVCARLGDTVAAAKLYELLLPHADQIAGAPVGWFGSVAYFLALLAATLGRVEDAEKHFTDAEATSERMGAPSWLARTRLEWGRMLVLRGGTGDADRARALLGQALATARQLGLGTVERRAAAMLDQHT